MIFAPLLAAVQAAPCVSDPTIVTAVRARVQGADPLLGQGRVATVKVTIGTDGRVTDSQIFESSGDAAADAAALTAARNSTYAPAMQNCRPIAQTVYFDEVVRPDYAHMSSNDCATQVTPATTLRTTQPAYPDAARSIKAGGIAAVKITIGPDGSVMTAELIQSTGNRDLDKAALDAADNSIYAPKVVNCKPMTAAYTFKVTFVPR